MEMNKEELLKAKIAIKELKKILIKLKEEIELLQKDMIIHDRLMAESQMKATIKLMEMAKNSGIKKVLGIFDFELNNGVVSYETLKKLKQLNKEYGR